MPRPKKCRQVAKEPKVTYFKPAGIPLRELKEVELSVDELEAIRLVDMKCVEQIEAGKKMRVSQPTLHRLLVSGRKKISEALSNGYAIKINGGNYCVSNTEVDDDK